jgi:hypothetical protein
MQCPKLIFHFFAKSVYVSPIYRNYYDNDDAEGSAMRLNGLWILCVLIQLTTGCATQKDSHTARTGVEQLLISNAVDRSLDQIDYSPFRDKQVYLETKYLECVDKNYVIGSLRQRILHQNGRLLEKADGADVIVEVASGGVGTDTQELFVGIPEIPLPPPSPIAIPRLAFLTRTKMNGTAKILVNAYDAKTKVPLTAPGANLARSDQNNWNVMGIGPVQSGTVPREIAAATKEVDLSATAVVNAVGGAYIRPQPGTAMNEPAETPRIRPVGYRR